MNDTPDPLEILDAIDRERGDSLIGMIQANQVQRLRNEIVALRNEIVAVRKKVVDLDSWKLGLLYEASATGRAGALEEAARLCERCAAAIRALKDKA